jgi:putative tricarboxylic transport membrane protein
MDRRVDIAISAFMIAFGLFVILQATTIKSGLFTDPIGPRAFFYGCGVIFILGGVANIAQKLASRRLFPGPMVPAEGVEDEGHHPASAGRAAAIALASLVYMLSFRPLGYLIATPLYVVLSLRILNERNWVLNAVVAVVFTGIFYVIFAQLLGVWLPVGPFTQLFRDLGWIIL